MDDKRIVELYFDRNESAISETAKKYGRYCHYIAYNILRSDQDAEECVNDTYLRAWEAMPPHKPQRLSVFLGKLTRNLSLNRYAFERAQKRGDGTELVLEEIAEVVADPESEVSVVDEIALKDALNEFLASLSEEERIIFVRRYWYISPVKEIAESLGCGESRVKTALHRLRGRLKLYLEGRDIQI